MKSLNLGASVAPRIAQAASQSQVSRAEISRCSSAGGGRVSSGCVSDFLTRCLREPLPLGNVSLSGQRGLVRRTSYYHRQTEKVDSRKRRVSSSKPRNSV